jgi:hypothetical protein
MAQPKINSIGGLKQYILRSLGYPAHTIEITDEQLDDVIDDTVQDYVQFAYSGVTEIYIPITVIKDVQDYILPYEIFAVLGVNDANMSMIGANLPSNMFSMNQFIAADLYRPGVAKIDLAGYEMINQLTSSIDIIFAKKKTFDFNCVSKVLHLHGKVHDDENIILQCYQTLTVDTTEVSAGSMTYVENNIYNDRWVKRMATAKAMLQWGKNIGLKYLGSALPNGGSLNGDGIMNLANTQIEKLEAELHDRYELPVDFFVA